MSNKLREEMREAGKRLKIAMLTANSATEEAAKALQRFAEASKNMPSLNNLEIRMTVYHQKHHGTESDTIAEFYKPVPFDRSEDDEPKRKPYQKFLPEANRFRRKK